VRRRRSLPWRSKMATRTTVTLRDDFDGGPAEETVWFGLGAVDYEIDLSAANAGRFCAQLAPLIEHARRPACGQCARPGRTSGDRRDSAEVRAWAKEHGIDISERGASPWQSVTDLPTGVRISTELPTLTTRYLQEHGVDAVVIPSHGATEAKVPDIVDAIVDITDTGSPMRGNGLRILETLLTSYPELIANTEAYTDPAKRAAMDDIALLLQSVIEARGNVLLKLNVPANRLQEVTKILPAMSSPTITTLARADMNGVETVAPKRSINTLIPALKAAGALDILEIPIAKIVE
jgi:ATP phosphoribosyltransferase-like protein